MSEVAAKQAMSDEIPRAKIYEMYLSTAEKVSDRRASMNAWMLSIHSGIGSLYAVLSKIEPSGPATKAWEFVVPSVGLIVCVSWLRLLQSYALLNQTKFRVLQDMEAAFATAPLTREQEIYRSGGRKGFHVSERMVPYAFALLYGFLIAMAILSFLGKR